VYVRVIEEDEVYPISVFGIATEAEAVEEALGSFGVTAGEHGEYKVTRVEKLP
jgi:hypothetical protein